MLQDIRARSEEITDTCYNSLLMNVYSGNFSALSAYINDSKWLGKDFDTPLLSFSAVIPNEVSPGVRDIIFRGTPGTEASGNKAKLPMDNDSLTIVRGASTRLLWALDHNFSRCHARAH